MLEYEVVRYIGSAMKEKKFNQTLHGARGLAALMVVFSHVGVSGVTDNFFMEIPIFLSVFKYVLLSGQYGVEIFFMISGYLITISINRHKTVASFLLDRCIRIYPVFLPAILFIFIFGPLAGYHYFAGFSWFDWLKSLVFNLLFIPGVIPIKAALVVAWSLSYEAVFYLAISFLKYYQNNKKVLCFFVVFGAIPFLLMLPRAFFFLVGASLYYLLPINNKKWLRMPKLFFLNIIMLIAVLFLIQFHSEIGIPLSHWQTLILRSFSIILGYFFFVEVVVQSPPAVLFLKWRWIQFLGTVSYSLYIWHTLVLFGTKRVFAGTFEIFGSYGSFFLFSITSLFLSILVALVSYILLEKKAYNIMARYRRKGKDSSVVLTESTALL